MRKHRSLRREADGRLQFRGRAGRSRDIARVSFAGSQLGLLRRDDQEHSDHAHALSESRRSAFDPRARAVREFGRLAGGLAASLCADPGQEHRRRHAICSATTSSSISARTSTASAKRSVYVSLNADLHRSPARSPANIVATRRARIASPSTLDGVAEPFEGVLTWQWNEAAGSARAGVHRASSSRGVHLGFQARTAQHAPGAGRRGRKPDACPRPSKTVRWRLPTRGARATSIIWASSNPA